MNQKHGYMKKLLLCVSLFLSFLTGCTPKTSTGTCYAEKIRFEEIRTGDQIVITGNDTETALSKWERSYGIEPAVIRKGTEEGREVLTYISDNTEVFHAEVSDKGVLLQGEKGYLGIADKDKAVQFRTEENDGCYWNSNEEGKIHVRSSWSDGNDVDIYLGYYYKYRVYYGFYTKQDGSAPGVETYSVYRVTDAWKKRNTYEHGYRLKLFETSDIHGVISYDDGTDWQLRMAKTAWIVNQERNRTGEKRNDTVLLLDGGDVFQGSLFSTLLGWEPMSAVFDTMDYDAVAVGNHEFDKGLDYVMDPDGTMMDYTRNGTDYRNEIPYVLCNLYQNGKKVKGLRDYVILEKTAVNDKGKELPVRIGVIGFAEDYSGSVSKQYFTEAGFAIREDYDDAMNLAKQLKEEEGCQAVILLAHGDSGGIAENLKEGCAIDLILGGHKHILINGETPWGLKYASPGNKADSILNAELVFEPEQGKPVLREVQNVHPYYITMNASLLYDTEENRKTMDKEVYVLGNDYWLLLASMLNIKIGYITTSALRYEYLPGSRKSSCTAGNWMASIIQRAGNADIGFVNSGGIRQDVVIPEGSDHRDINAGDIYTMFPFGDHIDVFELTYEELVKGFEYAISDGGWGLLSRMVGIDCIFDSISEPRVILKLVTYDGETIYDNGNWKEGWKDKKVTVAMPQYSAESDRESSTGLHNPFVEWINTDRLVRDDITDVEAAITVLSEEAELKNGLLEIDPNPHMLDVGVEPEKPAEQPE
ncbi:MAG: 5'-nucleotidase C-terminal domain-containing protein [Solobacterium sp.]|nr:5'-nucleotidase C-terminal domain-containing protein [Solobacterium sp.]